MHDTWLRSVKATVNFIGANLKFLELLPHPKEGKSSELFMQVAVKRSTRDLRKFRHFASFEASFATR